MQRILIVKMWALGDILLATPLLRALKRQYPDCSISWLVEKEYADILQGNPLVDHVIPFDSGVWRRHFRQGRFITYLRISTRLRKSLIDQNFDILINLTAEKWWSVWFNVAPRRIGLFPRQNPGLIGRLYSKAIPRTRDPWLHNTQHYQLPAEALGILGPYDEQMVVGVSDMERNQAAELLLSDPGYRPDKPLIILHPGTSQASKCWPIENFASVASQLSNHYNIAITGSPNELAMAESLSSALPEGLPKPIIACGRLTIGGTSALVERAVTVVTGDTSLLHISSALDIPLVGIYGSTRPRDNAPLFGKSILLFDDTVECAPCYKSQCPLHGAAHMRCQRNISVAQVTTAARSLAEARTQAIVHHC